MGRGERRNNGRTARQRIVGCLASHGENWSTAALDPGIWYYTAKYAKGVLQDYYCDRVGEENWQ